MLDRDRELMRGVAVLGEVAAPVLETLLEDGFVQVLAKDTVLFQQGEAARFLHVILDGRIGLTARSDEGQETVVEFFKAGDVFIAPAVILELPYLMAARVVDEARILMVRGDRFRALMEEDHGLALAVARELARHWRLLVRQIKDLKLRSAPQRVGSYLLGLAGEATDGASLRLPEERRMLAARLAMTPESLSRAFARLREVGVSGRGRRVEIDDLGRLRAFCSYDDLA
jgi:CRP/FNR family transcriptional regulator, transcriptional activator FtrB